ncbi:universal stress protein [Sutcliffiella halmapala]|uniref:universal stress protein n=1 Tax=Sutcliffiella halmapala TaxID=79882 RepID=UPI0009950B85|nr:universal stress protein [Sutcliffiella halmapala]
MNHTYQNILVAVDGSEEGKLAFNKAITMCQQNNAALYLAHIIDTQTFPTMEAHNITMPEQAEVHAKELLEEYGEIAKASGISSIKTILEYGSPKHIVPKELAEEHHIDLLVCGSSGLNLAERLVLGSVSENIVRHAKCDVLVVRADKN